MKTKSQHNTTVLGIHGAQINHTQHTTSHHSHTKRYCTLGKIHEHTIMTHSVQQVPKLWLRNEELPYQRQMYALRWTSLERRLPEQCRRNICATLLSLHRSTRFQQPRMSQTTGIYIPEAVKKQTQQTAPALTHANFPAMPNPKQQSSSQMRALFDQTAPRSPHRNARLQHSSLLNKTQQQPTLQSSEHKHHSLTRSNQPKKRSCLRWTN